MSSDIKKIGGKNYNKNMLQNAEDISSRKKGGKLSLADAKKVFSGIDSGEINEVNRRTVSYLLETYTFTESALKWIEETVAAGDSFIEPEIEQEKAVYNEIYRNDIEETESVSNLEKKGSRGRIFIIAFILLLIAAIVGFFLINKDKDPYPAEIQESKDLYTDDETILPVAIEDSEPEKTVIPEESDVKAYEYYTVKEKDTLVLISIKLYGDYTRWQDIYRLNSDIIRDPGLVYPGQKLKLPQK